MINEQYVETNLPKLYLLSPNEWYTISGDTENKLALIKWAMNNDRNSFELSPCETKVKRLQLPTWRELAQDTNLNLRVQERHEKVYGRNHVFYDIYKDGRCIATE